MSDEKRSPISRLIQVLIPLAGIAIGLTSLLLTLAAKKKELTCTYLGSTSLVSLGAGGVHPDVRMEFRGENITSLTKMSFSLRNTGAAPIRSSDVLENVKLTFPSEVRVLNASVERTAPQPFQFAANALPGTSAVQLEFPLLNAGDEAIVAVYVFNSEPRAPVLSGRIIDVSQFVFSQVAAPNQTVRNFPLIRSRGARRVMYWALLVFHSVTSLLFFSVGSYAIVNYVKEFRWKKQWADKYATVLRDAKRDYLAELMKDSWTPDKVEQAKKQIDTFTFDVPKDRLEARLTEVKVPKPPNTSMTTNLLTAVMTILVMFGIATLAAITVVIVQTTLSP